jgi:hypothetical protein
MKHAKNYDNGDYLNLFLNLTDLTSSEPVDMLEEIIHTNGLLHRMNQVINFNAC